MSFKVTNWEFSKETNMNNYVLPDEGECIVKIVDAYYDAKGDEYGPKYSLTLLDLHKEGQFVLEYRPDGDGKPARAHRGTLISLGEALAGVPIGRPNPEDIKGGVVVAEITHKESVSSKDGTIRKYPRCYKFKAAPQEMVEGFSDIEQYYEGSSDKEITN